MNKMSKKKIFLLIAGVIALVVLQREFLIPMAKDVATKSDLFLIDSKDQGSNMSQSSPMTELAFQHCNKHLKADLDEKTTVTLPAKALNAWSLGNYEYVVSAEADVSHEGSAPKKHKYVCRISYNNGDDTSGAPEFDNWSLVGMSKIDDNQ